jgi:hypothetical protein
MKRLLEVFKLSVDDGSIVKDRVGAQLHEPSQSGEEVAYEMVNFLYGVTPTTKIFSLELWEMLGANQQLHYVNKAENVFLYIEESHNDKEAEAHYHSELGNLDLHKQLTRS